MERECQGLKKRERRAMENEERRPDLCNVIVMTLDVFEMRLGWRSEVPSRRSLAFTSRKTIGDGTCHRLIEGSDLVSGFFSVPVAMTGRSKEDAKERMAEDLSIRYLSFISIRETDCTKVSSTHLLQD